MELSILGMRSIGSFEKLKKKLCETPILSLPEGVDDFTIYSDASGVGMCSDPKG